MKNVTYAGFWRRHLAYCLDLFILIFSSSLLSFFTLSLGFGLGSFAYEFVQWFVALATIFYFVVFHFHFAQTPGKMALGIKVVDKDSLSKISFKQSLGRAFATILSGLPFLLGYFWAAWTKERTTFHDLLAQTRVVYTEKPAPSWVVFLGNLLIFLLSLLLLVFLGLSFLVLILNPDNLNLLLEQSGKLDVEAQMELFRQLQGGL